MSITVDNLIKEFGLNKAKRVKWGKSLETESEGVYIVSLSDKSNSNNGVMKEIQISESILQKWIKKVDGFEIDKKITFNEKIIVNRLSEFWLPNENILYIGKAPIRQNGKGLNNRVQEFYNTEYGENGPHAGGHWIKAISNLTDLYVYYIVCKKPSEIEYEMLKYFGNNISSETKQHLRDSELVLPFANIEITKGKRKKHGLGKMKK